MEVGAFCAFSPLEVLWIDRMHIAFFGHDSADSAIRRRVFAFQRDGFDVTGFMMRRRESSDVTWDNVDLGMTRDAAYLDRIKSVFTGAAKACEQADKLKSADIIYARNLDMLATAFEAKRRLKLDTPVIYESLDVHRLLSRKDIVGNALRQIEGRLLNRCRGLVVSSPGFLRNHFDVYYPGKFKAYLVENKLANGADYGERPVPILGDTSQPLKLGWVGILRCQRSLHALAGLATQMEGQLEIHLHGIPAESEVPDFQSVVDSHPNMHFWGRYRAPEDLAKIYDNLDVVWAGDYMEAGQNSVWLLPNRIYEGGYYGTPSIAPANTETAAFLERHQCGFTIEEPIETTLAALISRLNADRAEILDRANTLYDMETDNFVQPDGFLKAIIEDCLSRS